ncbi:PREDICTED: uncharacterized protein LOC108770843 [Trachymyrmex cornetzi]|uniref:uncharacterized protein LOC108770843 n=1 Tax=Trachymyrmex cornetzi TaxID=471704 RepID=UPI00084F6867|nr:PREDICTED: uncharacterized protein LOC108770843 [Trachymyrmex cornetzi]
MWITNVRQINGYSWQPMNSSVVCSKHFDVSSWEKIREDGKRKLKFGAVPSIFNNLAQISANDHIYSRTLKDITNTRTFLPINKTSVSTSTNTIEKNISKTPEVESDLIDNGNSDIILNNSDVPTNICTITPSNALNSLSELMEEVDNAVTVQTIKEQNIDNMTVSLKKENEQLKKELARVKKIADKVHQENETLRKSNTKLRREKESFTNIKKK